MYDHNNNKSEFTNICTVALKWLDNYTELLVGYDFMYTASSTTIFGDPVVNKLYAVTNVSSTTLTNYGTLTLKLYLTK